MSERSDPGTGAGRRRPLPTAKQTPRPSRAAAGLRAAAAAVGRVLGRDPLALFLLVASVVITVAFATLLSSTLPSSPGDRVELSQVSELARAKQIDRATLLDQDSRVVAVTQDGRVVWAAYPSSDVMTDSLRRELGRGGAEVGIDQQSGKPVRQVVVQFLLPILLLVCLFAFFTRIGQDGGSAGFAAFSKFTGKGKKRKKGAKGQITFDHIAGADEAVIELKEIRDYLADPSKYSRIGARAPKGVLLVGPPGTGKTLLARATAGEADAAFFSLSGAEFVESLVGVGAARVRDLFAKARKMAPSIVFIDELDAAGRKRGAGVGQGNDEREQTLNQLLVEMDGFDGDAGIVVMAATNRPDILDPALLRPGRFDRQVTVDVPDVFGRHEILRLYVEGRPLAADVDLMEIAKLCPGFSGAELANLVNEAALLSIREGDGELTMPVLEEAIERVVAGPAKRSHVLTESERWTIAVHEASHAVVSRSIGQSVSAQKLSIVARGRQLGTAAHMLADRDQVLMRESDLHRQLVTIVAGLAGELHAFGEISSGVHDDLHAATQIARSMVSSFGMSPAVGPMTVGERQGEVFLGASLQDLGSISEATLAAIDGEVRRILEESRERAGRVLARNWDAVRETAESLIEHETLSGLALDAVLSTVQPVSLDELRGLRVDGDGGARA
ncbi:MAG TPA: ATP-dependent zinc metalloprotease FtsH [Solirubrobacteraceae bacterium]|nr:ATP-dependent zinc metalloprotease FtsH [Solirubrobacteraceae bacterium]